MMNIFKEIGIILKTHGKESNIPYLFKNCNIQCTNSHASVYQSVLSLDNGDTITNLYGIVNTFNNDFASIAETTKK